MLSCVAMIQKSAYAKAGVDYSLMEPFKMAMIETGKKTLKFPNKRDVFIREDITHSHGAVFEYKGSEKHMWAQTQEGLGNKNWIAEWMYLHEGTGNTYYEGIGIDTALMIVNDIIAQGAMPVVFTDHIDVGNSEWFADEKRSRDLATGFLRVCEESGMALPAGETATLKYLVNPEPPITIAPSLSGSVTGIIAPATRLITGKIEPGYRIIGVASSGLHANGVSLVIKEALALPDKFLTKLPSGITLGASALTPTRSYVALVEALLDAGIEIGTLLPGTGDGVGKIAFDKRAFTYRITQWPKVPEFFTFFRENGLPLKDCLKTFNWGVGYYIFVPPYEVERTIKIGTDVGYEMTDLGVVEKGERCVLFELENITLPPPGE